MNSKLKEKTKPSPTRLYDFGIIFIESLYLKKETLKNNTSIPNEIVPKFTNPFTKKKQKKNTHTKNYVSPFLLVFLFFFFKLLERRI